MFKGTAVGTGDVIRYRTTKDKVERQAVVIALHDNGLLEVRSEDRTVDLLREDSVDFIVVYRKAENAFCESAFYRHQRVRSVRNRARLGYVVAAYNRRVVVLADDGRFVSTRESDWQ
jgi:hypothetical protein